MKKAQIIIFIIILIFMSFLIPTLSYGAELSEAVPGIPPEKNSQMWITGIFYAMRKYESGWLDTAASRIGTVDPSTGRVLSYTEWGNEVSSNLVIKNHLAKNVYPGEMSRNGLIYYVGGLCYGHNYVNNKNKVMVPRALIDVNPNSPLFHQYDKQLLAYAVRRSWDNHEVGAAGSSYYKKCISIWVNERAASLGITSQRPEAAGGNLDALQAEGYSEINGLANEKFLTNSVSGDGATQSIEYKNGNTFIGPYNLNTSWGGLTSATITQRDNAGNIETTYGSIDGTNIIPLNQISEYNGNNFYIVIPGREIESVQKIDLRKNFTYNATRAMFAEGQGNGGQNIAVFYGERRNWTSTLVLPEVPYSNIKIKKVDEDTNQHLPKPVGFIVYNETERKWVKQGSKIEYVDNKEDATTFYTDANGEVTIKNLSKKGKYIVYEVVNPNFGYDAATYDDPSQEIITEIKALGQNSELTVNNKRKYIKVSRICMGRYNFIKIIC